MVQKAGNPNSQMTSPKPNKERRAWKSLEPDSLKKVVE